MKEGNEYIILADTYLFFSSAEIKQMALMNMALKIKGVCNRLHSLEIMR